MRRSVTLFEHETIRVDQRLRSPSPDARLRRSDFDALVRFNDVAGQRYFRVGHQSLTARHFVGYLEIGELEIEILPKAAIHGAVEAGPWRDALLEMLRVVLGLRIDTPSAASQAVRRPTLLHVIVERFLIEVQLLIRHGLARGYRDEETNGSTFRGKLLVAEQVRENLVRADRFFVRHATYDRDITVNRILRTALERLCASALPAPIATRAATLVGTFEGVRSVRATPSVFERIQLGRSTSRYRDALTLARLLLEQRGPQLRAGAAPVFAILFDMNVLWERYVAALIRRVAGELTVRTQESCDFWAASTLPVRKVRPDIVVLRGTERVLVADTKWKVVHDGVPSDDDLKQMFVYNELLGTSRAVLIHPSVGEGVARSGAYAARGHRCETAQLSVLEGGVWNRDALERQLRALLEPHLRSAAVQTTATN